MKPALEDRSAQHCTDSEPRVTARDAVLAFAVGVLVAGLSEAIGFPRRLEVEGLLVNPLPSVTLIPPRLAVCLGTTALVGLFALGATQAWGLTRRLRCYDAIVSFSLCLGLWLTLACWGLEGSPWPIPVGPAGAASLFLSGFLGGFSHPRGERLRYCMVWGVVILAASLFALALAFSTGLALRPLPRGSDVGPTRHDLPYLLPALYLGAALVGWVFHADQLRRERTHVGPFGKIVG